MFYIMFLMLIINGIKVLYLGFIYNVISRMCFVYDMKSVLCNVLRFYI